MLKGQAAASDHDEEVAFTCGNVKTQRKWKVKSISIEESSSSDSEASGSDSNCCEKRKFVTSNKKLLLKSLNENLNSESFLTTSTPAKKSKPISTHSPSDQSTPLYNTSSESISSKSTSSLSGFQLGAGSREPKTPDNISNSTQDDDELRKMVKMILRQNKELIERVSNLEENLSRSTKKKDPDIKVPNTVRYHVKLAYNERLKSGGIMWNQDDQGPFSDQNLEFTRYIRKFVEGLHGELANRDIIINRAIQMYFDSKVAQAKRTKKDPQITKKIAHHQRKIHLSNRRKKALKENVPFEVIQERDREVINSALCPEMMSSEDERETEEGNRFFLVHRPPFRKKRLNKIMKVIDQAYISNMSKRSKDQMIPRRLGEDSKTAPSNSLKRSAALFICE